MKNGKISISLFPNSGHHYYFVPLAIAQGQGTEPAERFSTDEDLPSLEPAVVATLGSLCLSGAEWMEAIGADLLWLRGKFGVRRESTSFGSQFAVYGVWCAIETNIGTRSDGYNFDTDSSPSQNDDGWKSAMARVATPYVATKYSAIDYSQSLKIDLDRCFEISNKIGAPIGKCMLEINWQIEGGEPVPVALIVDFGNTRTVALGLELAKHIANNNFRAIFQPLNFKRGYDDAISKNMSLQPNELIPDSWIILREPTFSAEQFMPPSFSWADYITKDAPKNFWKRKTQKKLEKIVNRMPFMFVELSPAVLGPEATDLLAGSDVFGGHLSFLSSPKRYAWDDNPVGHEGESVWYMHPRTGVGATRQLAGEIFRFLPRNSDVRQLLLNSDEPQSPTEWDDESLKPSSKPSPPDFPKGDALIWSALAILERAGRQIQSEGWRSKSPVRRYLESVTVTFPPGWTNEELLAYWKAWFLAKEIYNWSRGSRPVSVALDLRLDEAVASQLAIVFSEIRRFNSKVENWIRAFGKTHNGTIAVRVLTVDIGGGTTDTAVVEYSNGAVGPDGVHLITEVLFSDSTANAGDKLVRNLIESVLLPTLGERFQDVDKRRSGFENFFSMSLGMREEEDRLRRMVITRSVFVPIVYKWLEDLSSGREGNPSTGAKWDPLECGANYSQIDKLNQSFRDAGLAEDALLQANQPFDVDYSKIKKVIIDWCKPLALLHAEYLRAFEVDLVIVTGKPSELPNVRSIFEETLPAQPDRIIFAKDYKAGEWFPAAKEGRIPDAKMVTVVGAALYNAIKNDLLDGWKIDHKVGAHARNYWGVASTLGGPFAPDDIILEPNESTVELDLTIGSYIARSRFITNDSEPVYVLRSRRALSNKRVSLRINRISTDPQGRLLRNEHLRIEGVAGVDNENVPLTIEDIELKLCTLAGEVHWLDQGSFVVKWH